MDRLASQMGERVVLTKVQGRRRDVKRGRVGKIVLVGSYQCLVEWKDGSRSWVRYEDLSADPTPT